MDPIAIITLISDLALKVWAQCHAQTSSEDPQDILKAHYNAASGTFDPDFIDELVPGVRRARNQAWRQCNRKDRQSFERLDRNSLRALAESEALKAMNLPQAEAAAIMAAVNPAGDGT